MNRTVFLFVRALMCGLVLLFTVTSASSQFKASVQGTVTDSAGAIVTGASVTLTNKETSRSEKTETSDGGFYRFSGLAPGLYTVTVEKENFKKQVVDDVKEEAESLKGVKPGIVYLKKGAAVPLIGSVLRHNFDLRAAVATIFRRISAGSDLNLFDSLLTWSDYGSAAPRLTVHA